MASRTPAQQIRCSYNKHVIQAVSLCSVRTYLLSSEMMRRSWTFSFSLPGPLTDQSLSNGRRRGCVDPRSVELSRTFLCDLVHSS